MIIDLLKTNRWYVDTMVPNNTVYVFDPDEIAQLFLDDLYIGIIIGKENIKFLKEHLKCI